MFLLLVLRQRRASKKTVGVCVRNSLRLDLLGRGLYREFGRQEPRKKEEERRHMRELRRRVKGV